MEFILLLKEDHDPRQGRLDSCTGQYLDCYDFGKRFHRCQKNNSVVVDLQRQSPGIDCMDSIIQFSSATASESIQLCHLYPGEWQPAMNSIQLNCTTSLLLQNNNNKTTLSISYQLLLFDYGLSSTHATLAIFVADGVFYAELNEFFQRELAAEGYSGVEVRVTPARTEIIIRATQTQEILG
ncbi:40S ribosomal protein S3, partial [Mortierella sp. AD032]